MYRYMYFIKLQMKGEISLAITKYGLALTASTFQHQT